MFSIFVHKYNIDLSPVKDLTPFVLVGLQDLSPCYYVVALKAVPFFFLFWYSPSIISWVMRDPRNWSEVDSSSPPIDRGHFRLQDLRAVHTKSTFWWVFSRYFEPLMILTKGVYISLMDSSLSILNNSFWWVRIFMFDSFTWFVTSWVTLAISQVDTLFSTD